MANGKNASIGMSRSSGKQISRKTHIAQSINDIITTPIGSRVMRRYYGSYLFELIDSAMNDAGRLRLTAALVDAINRWEPRAEITFARVETHADGRTSLEYQYRDRDGLSAQPLSGLALLADNARAGDN